MKIQHLKYALAVADTGSINRASEKLLLSQPNLSSALKTLELELGFPIFSRSSSGVSATAQGQEFLLYARKILQEYEQITRIKSRQRIHHLSVLAGCHAVAGEAFSLLCAEYSENRQIDFSLRSDTTAGIINRIYRNEGDLGVILLPKLQSDAAPLSLVYEKKGLALHFIDMLQFYIYLRAQHPLLQNGTLDMDGLWEYPFVDFGNQGEPSAAEAEHLRLLNPDRRISVDNRNTGFQIVSASNACGCGCGRHPGVQTQHLLVSVPVPGVRLALFAVFRRDYPLPAPGQRYLQLLRQEAASPD